MAGVSEEGEPAVDPGLAGGGGEEFVAGFEDGIEVVADVDDGEAEVELDGAAVEVERFAAEVVVPVGKVELLEVEEDLGDGCMGAAAIGVDGFDDAFEGCVLVVLHFQRGDADAL